MAQNTSHAVMAQRHEGAESFDLFPTPPWATRALCEFLNAGDSRVSNRSCWEPACGLGHMARPLSEYFLSVYSSDVVAYGFGAVRDFLFPYAEPPFDWVVTNPPFKLAEQFAHKALAEAREGVALLVRTAFLESVGRYRNLFQEHPPTTVLQFAERVPMVKGRLDAEASTATSYCWIVWHRNPSGRATAFAWIPPCRRRLERASDYEVAA